MVKMPVGKQNILYLCAQLLRLVDNFVRLCARVDYPRACIVGCNDIAFGLINSYRKFCYFYMFFLLKYKTF